jgi:pimeloyl-ACP methyl ester carboxylesterase
MVGYSLGGGISATFTSYFPDMVNRLVLISPTSLIRNKHGGKRAGFRVVSTLIPKAILNPLSWKFLTNDLLRPKNHDQDTKTESSNGIAEVELLKTDAKYV